MLTWPPLQGCCVDGAPPFESTIERLTDYVRFVQENRDELKALYEDILISVTKFFREPEAFEALKTKVFPRLLEQRDPNQPIRVWVYRPCS